MEIPEGYILMPIEPTYQIAEVMDIKWESGEGFPIRWKNLVDYIKTNH